MALIKKNPHLPDYFVEIDGVSVESDAQDIPSIVDLYEEPKVIYFPDLKPHIDNDFWGGLDIPDTPTLKKISTSPRVCGIDNVGGSDTALKLMKSGISDDILAARIAQHMESVIEQLLPIYLKLFSPYRFTRSNICWRLNRTYAENLHVDAYRESMPNHFARMFINLDNQPRIWHTSWRACDLVEKVGPKLDSQSYAELDANALWAKINTLIFGKNSLEWWDDQPRHIAFFDPGDVWVVDSRLVSHQIFYGRRALSIDFFVDPASMKNPAQHYLEIAEALRRRFGPALART